MLSEELIDINVTETAATEMDKKFNGGKETKLIFYK